MNSANHNSQTITNASEKSSVSNSDDVIVRTLINADYETTHDDMLQVTLDRIDKKKQSIITPNELWIVEHNDVYTLGQAGKEEHILERNDTPIIHTDRGGQVTWHGKGQLVIYWLMDLNKVGWNVRELVSHAEQSIEDTINETLNQKAKSLDTHDPFLQAGYYAKSRQDAPGVYIYNSDEHMLGKIASLGFKIKHGFSYHGIAVNLACDLNVFNAINPCGYANLQMLRLADFCELHKSSNSSINSKCNQDIDFDINQAHQLKKPHLKSDENDCFSTLGLDKIEGTITEYDYTQKLIVNIIQRVAGDIKLRDK